MRDEDTKFPRFSYDLLQYLDETIKYPQFPASARQFAKFDEEAVRSSAFTMGARQLVDELLAWHEEQEGRDDEVEEEVTSVDISDGPTPIFPKLFGPDGHLREILPSRWMDGGTSK